MMHCRDSILCFPLKNAFYLLLGYDFFLIPEFSDVSTGCLGFFTNTIFKHAWLVTSEITPHLSALNRCGVPGSIKPAFVHFRIKAET